MNRTIYKINEHSFFPEYLGTTVKKQNHDEYCTVFDSEIKERINLFYTGKESKEITVNQCYKKYQPNVLLGDLYQEEATIYHFFQIDCEKETDIVITPQIYSSFKLWVNFELYTYIKKSKGFYIIRLKKGANILVCELANPKEKEYLTLRISSLEHEKKTPYSFCNGRLQSPHTLCSINRSGNFLWEENKIFDFMFFPNNDPLVIPDNAVSIRISRISYNGITCTKEIISEAKIPPLTKYSYDLSDIAYDANTYTYFRLDFEYVYANGTVYKNYVNIFTYYPQTAIEALCDTVNKHFPDQTDYDKVCINYYVDKINALAAKTAKTTVALQFFQKFEKILPDGHFEDELYTPGFKELQYYSERFEENCNYFAHIPQNYDPNKKYPLLIIAKTIAIVASEYFSTYDTEDLIVIDILLKGITLGSYIGDAALWDTYSEVKKRYNIDEDRVYITGASNGGGASLVQGQLYPHRFAGIYAFIAGGANPAMAKNLSNLKVVTMSSPYESAYGVFQKMDVALKNISHPDYTGILIENYSHITIQPLWFNKYVIDSLLQSRRNAFPDHISYRTTRNRYRKAYWGEIHSIEYGQFYAEFEADVKDGNIYVNLVNATGITLTLPPQISKTKFKLTVNGSQTFSFENYDSDAVILIKKGNDYQLTDTYEPIVDLHKGNGLLDVYLDPLAICIPGEAVEDNPLYEIAKRFSKPTTNGYNPVVNVSYPIETTTSILNTNYLHKKSMIVLDDLSDVPILNTIRQNAQIAVDLTGFKYNGNRIETGYCIMQIVKNPWNSERNIVLVSSNSPTVLSRNFFIRNVVLPTYINDYHPYWNNDALIFTGREYLKIFEFGMNIEKIV